MTSSDLIGKYIDFIHRDKFGYPASEDLMRKWEGIPKDSLDKELNNLYRIWGFTETHVRNLQKRFNHIHDGIAVDNKRRPLVLTISVIIGLVFLVAIFFFVSNFRFKHEMHTGNKAEASKLQDPNSKDSTLKDLFDVSREVEAIREEFSKINSKVLSAKAYNYRNKCGVEDANVTVYYDGNEVRKITDVGEGDDDKAPASWSYQFYYLNGELIFSYRMSSYFDVNLEKTVKTQTREYIRANTILKKIVDGVTTFPNNAHIDVGDFRILLYRVSNLRDIEEIYSCHQDY